MRNTFEVPEGIFERTPTPFTEVYYRRCLRVLRMVGILHGKGFHGLRVLPYIYPISYRIELYPGAYAKPDGVQYDENLIPGGFASKLIARYTGASEARFFGWEDAESANAHELALLFIKRFPELCQDAFYLDYAYAGWFTTLLAHCEYGALPYLFEEYKMQVPGAMRMLTVRAKAPEYFPSPPTPSYGHTLLPAYNFSRGWQEADNTEA